MYANTRLFLSRIGTTYEDVTTEVLGLIGPWQLIVTFVSTNFMITNFFNHYDEIFLIKPTDNYACRPSVPVDESVNVTLCFVTKETNITKCKKWQYKLMGIVWIKKTWLTFCQDKLNILSMAMVCRLGSAFGCIIFGLVADGFGRKKAILIGVFIELPLRLIVTFCDSESWFRLLMFLRSLFASANFYMGLIIVCEISSNVWRSQLMSLAASPHVFAKVFMIPIVNSLPNAETYSFIGCILSVALFVLLRWIPEVPHWLIYNRRITKAEKIVYRAAKQNQVNLCSEFKIRPVDHTAYVTLDEPATCCEILRTYNIRVTMIVMLLIWSLFEFLWVALYIPLIESEKTQKVTLLCTMACSAFFGCLTVLLAHRLKFRHLLVFNVILFGVLACGLVFISQPQIQILVSTMSASSAIIARYLILNITPRLFGIRVRATLFGCCYALGELGAILATLLLLLQALSAVTLGAFIISMTMVLAALCLVIPDVDGRELPDVMQDMDYYSELTKPIRWATQKTHSPTLEEIEMRVYSFGSHGVPAQTSSASTQRNAAKPIGCKRLWQRIVRFLRRNIVRK